jgi:hypothetical protein
MVGPQGLPALLAQRGYQVAPVSFEAPSVPPVAGAASAPRSGALAQAQNPPWVGPMDAATF